MKDFKRFKQLLSICRRSIICLPCVAFSLLLLLLLPPQLHAQSTGGRIRGTVTDASGGAITGAAVTLINEATHSTREVQTGASGEYIFLEVPVGTYEVDAASAGFKKYARKGIPLDLNEVISVDIALQVGGSTETVEVTGAPPVVDTTSTQLGAVVNDRASTQLPLNQRDVYQLLQLQPGVQSQLGNDLFYGSDKAGVVTVNGGRGRANNYTVNGGDGNDLFVNGPAIQPSPDSVDEFRVITNNFDAEYGRNSGAVVNVVTKSGTNELHGSFYEFFRNTVLNSRQFTFTPAPKTPFNQNQFGGTLGGPIIKDKTFVFGSYEGRRIVRGEVSQQIIVPTGAELNNGDFSAGSAFTGALNAPLVANMLQQRCGSGAPASVPASQKLSTAQQALVAGVAGGGPAVDYTTLFANNQVPTGCYDPVALSLVQFLPQAGGNSNTVLQVPKSRDRGDQGQVRVDHSFSPNQKTSVYYYIDDDFTIDPFSKFQSFGAITGEFPSSYATRTQQINVSHTSTIGPKAVNEARFSYFREGQGQFNTPLKTNAITASCGTGAASAFCFTGTADTAALNAACSAGAASTADCGIHSGLGSKFEGVPFIFFGGTGLIGNNPGGQLPQTGNTFQWADNYSRIIGSHSLKFGGDVRYQKFDQFLIFDINGDFTFSNTSSTSVSTVGFDNSLPNFLLGLPSNYVQGSPQHELIRSTSVYAFAQDSWKIKPNLTLNYGVRWELNTPLADAGHKVQAFRPGQQSTIYPCQLDPSNPLYNPALPDRGCAAAGANPLGIVFPGDKGVPSGLTQTYYKAFAPRLGLNWSPGARDGWVAKLTGGPGKTSISMGYGIFYNPIEQLVLEQFNAEPPFGGSITVPTSFLETPFISETGNVSPNPFTGVLNPPRGTPIDWSRFLGTVYFGDFQRHMRPQYSDQYNLTIKRELPGDILFQIGYVGSQGHRLLAIYEVNETNPQTCLEIAAIPTTLGGGCAQFGEDSVYSFTLPAASQCAGLGLAANCNAIDLPYYNPAGATGTGPNVPCLPVHMPAGCHYVNATGAGQQITLSGLRFYSSPNCNPLSGYGCNPNAPPISGIFAEDTVAHSNYNSLQVMLEKRFSRGIQFQASYTWSKTLDNASSFEDALNPFNFNATYGLSKFDARHRFVFNVVWDLPIPKYQGIKGVFLSGWEISAIETVQSGFPIRIQSQADNELLDSQFNFEAPGEPNLVSRFHTANPRGTVCAPGTGPLAQLVNPGVTVPACQPVSGYTFDPNLFDNCDNVTCPNDPFAVTLGTIGNSPRALCCGPGINNTDFSFSKQTPLTERLHMEFRADIFNIWNHAQFTSTDGNLSNATFGQPLRFRDPRLVQFALKFKF